MKKTKRILSLVLAVLLLAGLMTPIALAEEISGTAGSGISGQNTGSGVGGGNTGSGTGGSGNNGNEPSGSAGIVPAVDEAPVEYDFYYGGLDSENKRLMTDATYGKPALDAKFAEGTMNWTPVGGTAGTLKNTVPVFLKKISGIQIPSCVGEWFAFKLKSPGTGAYNVVLQSGLNTAGSKKAEVYILPLSVGESQEAIEAAMADDTYKLGTTVDFKAGQTPLSLGFWDFISGEDCLLVIKAVADSGGVTQVRYNNGVPYNAYMYVQKLSLVKKAYQEGVYNFAQNSYTGKNVTDTTASGETVLSELGAKYDAFTLNWKIENMNTSGTAAFSNSGLTVNGAEGDWIAYRVQLPGKGTYSFNLEYTAGAKGAYTARVYLMQAVDGMTQDDIQMGMISDNLLGKVSFEGSGTKSVDIGVGINLTGAEYLVVFEVYEAGAEGAKMQFGKLSTTPKVMVEYNFDLADKNNGIAEYSKLKLGSTFADSAITAVEGIAALYEEGKLNWKYYDGYNTREGMEDPLNGADFVRSYGMRHMTNMDSWYAYTIKSPGAGKFTLSLDYAVYSYGAEECAIYIIEKPAAGTDMKARVNKMVLDEDPIATVNMHGVALKDGFNATLGTYDFKADKEYVVIFYSMAPRAGYNSGVGYMMISHLIAVEGDVAGESEKRVNSVNLGEPVLQVSVKGRYGIAKIDGVEYYYMPMEGGGMIVYNLDTKEKVAEVETGINAAWSCETGPDGTCYVAGDATYVFKYNVVTGERERLYFAAKYSVAYDLEVAENGDFYFGHRGAESGGGVVKYDASEKEFIWYKKLDPTGVGMACKAVAYRDGYIYTAVYGLVTNDKGVSTEVHDLVKIDEETGEIVKRVDIRHLTTCRDPELYNNSKELLALTMVGDLLIGGATYLNHFVCFDINTMEYVDLGLIMGSNGDVSEVRDGKAYAIVYKGGLVEIDIENRTASYVPGFSTANVGFRWQRNTFVTFNHPDLPGESMMTVSTGTNGGPIFYNLQTGKTVSFPEWTSGDGGTPHTVRSVIASNDGSNMIFAGGYLTEIGVAYDTLNDRWAYEFKSTGQSDSLIMYEGGLYVGGYSTGTLGRIDYENGNSEALLSLTKDPTNYDNVRIHAIAAGGGKIFFGSIPNTNGLGGCLVTFDIETYDYVILDDFVHDQIIMKMFYKDGLLYGCTSVSGGKDSKPTQEVAKIFVYDVENNVKLGEFVVDIDGVSKDKVPFIAGLNVDKNGKMWGVIAETLFSFTYDRKNNSMEFTEEWSYSKTAYTTSGGRDWFGIPIIFHEDDIYISLPGARLRRINMQDTSDNEIMVAQSPKFYAIGEDGNLYYNNETKVMMLPLVYDDSDWAAAGKVDAQISALETQVTASNMHKVQAALGAYNALSDEQKGLVQNYSRLTTMHRRLVVAMIDNLPSELTLEDAAYVEEVRAQYNALAVVKRRFVTNIGELEHAEGVIINLNYLKKSEEAAALVMKHIDNIPADITLAAAGKINVARTAYNGLTDYQKTLVTNYQKLVDAEAALAVLVTAQNQTYADKVIAQIDALGTISLRSEKAIMMARLAYESLSADQKVLVTNYQKLVDAEAELARLKVEGDANIKAVEAVEALIKLIGDEISLDSKDTITAAREAYDALTDFQKSLVNNYDVLTQAETLLAELEAEQKQMIAIIVTVVIVAVVLVAGTVTLFVIPTTRAKIMGLFKKKSTTEAE